MANQRLDNLDPKLTVAEVKKKGQKSDEDGGPLEQLRDLVCGAGSWSLRDDIRLIAWSDRHQKWYCWRSKR